MSRKELVAGAVILALLILFAIDIASTGIYAAQHSMAPILPDGNGRNILAILIVIYFVGVTVVIIWAYRSNHPNFARLTEKYEVKARIPGSFFFALIPLVVGIFYSVTTYGAYLGTFFSLLSFPFLIFILILETRKAQD